MKDCREETVLIERALLLHWHKTFNLICTLIVCHVWRNSIFKYFSFYLCHAVNDGRSVDDTHDNKTSGLLYTYAYVFFLRENSTMVHTTASTRHLHYDVEKPGYRGGSTFTPRRHGSENSFIWLGYDRRHFYEHPHSSLGEYVVKPRSRTYASSSANLDEDWRPHGRHIEPKYSK